MKHGHAIQSQGLCFLTKLIDDRHKEDTLLTREINMSPNASLAQLTPQFDFDKPKERGSMPPGLEGYECLSQEILEVWKNQKKCANRQWKHPQLQCFESKARISCCFTLPH